MTTKTWIITGASRGFGRALAESALAAGDRVVAAVRRPESVADLKAGHPDHCLVATFDARDVAAAAPLVRDTLDRFGRLDVLVNNAGRAVVGAVEEVSDARLRELMDVHLFGPAALVRAALPAMRERGSGTIVQMSSQGGRTSFPGVAAYSASKFALEGWSEALAGEVAPFGIRVMIVEPSRFRTGFHSGDVMEFVEPSATYRDVLADVRADMAGVDGRQEGDPVRAAGIIVSLVHGDEVPLRLPLGREAAEPHLARLPARPGRGRAVGRDRPQRRLRGRPRIGTTRPGSGLMTTDDLMARALEALGDDGPLSAEAIHRLADLTDLPETMTIAEVAGLLDITPHTLRYYERTGLVEVARDGSGHRVYDAAVVRRLVFLTRMRLSGMPMRDLRHYISLVDAGEHTVPERLDVLVEHRDIIRRRIRELTLSLTAVEYKIATYGGSAGPDVPWSVSPGGAAEANGRDEEEDAAGDGVAGRVGQRRVGGGGAEDERRAGEHGDAATDDHRPLAAHPAAGDAHAQLDRPGHDRPGAPHAQHRRDAGRAGDGHADGGDQADRDVDVQQGG
ncbi:SDR family NAD(P)-dependent oxidoreductase [Nonomuraea mesophila]|uniref:SDR family NAD(P)-dependent oxidoreductase n=1 Tax=Nonomuraea mesophila TaxID=2530382 RepID=UPI001C7034CE|nr:SDR family NAD(P)-dependent oxidoreductase [Nonomuraea mesophila]